MAEEPKQDLTSAYDLHRDELLRQAQARLLARPRISIQLRFVAGLAVCFFACCAFALDTLVLLNGARGKLILLGTLDQLSSRVHEARLVERGLPNAGRQDLQDAQMNCYSAGAILKAERANLAEDFSDPALSGVVQSLERYRSLLREWESPDTGKGGQDVGRSRLHIATQETGLDLTNRIDALKRDERASLIHKLSLSENVPFLLLVIILVLFAGIAYLHGRSLRDPIRRFQSYVGRIGHANFGLIPPARAYRDEFTDLALALNQMLADLQTSQESCLRSAKLAAVGTITSGIAHELSNPLNNISITTESLMEDLKSMSDDQKWARLQDIYFETERASEIVKSLLDFTRLENPTLEPLDLVEVLRSSIRLIQNELLINNVEARLEAPQDLPKVNGSLNQLRQVFLNLFINAVQAMAGGGTLEVVVFHEKGDRVCVEVRDTGAGIPPDVLPRVFDPFFTTKEPGKGTGLGLSVSYSILMKHGGDIQVESSPGRGSIFHVCLPAAEEA